MKHTILIDRRDVRALAVVAGLALQWRGLRVDERRVARKLWATCAEILHKQKTKQHSKRNNEHLQNKHHAA